MQNSSNDYYFPRPENFKEWVYAIYKRITITLRCATRVKICVEEIQQIAVTVADLMVYKDFVNYYGECSICLKDMWNTDSIFTKCHHIFHETYINKRLNDGHSDCPMCRSVFDKKHPFLSSLDFEWECIENNDIN